MTKNYRDTISAILGRYSRPGDDLESSVLAGASEAIGASEATSIAAWVDGEADGEWGADPRHHDIAVDIRAAISRANDARAAKARASAAWSDYLILYDAAFDARAAYRTAALAVARNARAAFDAFDGEAFESSVQAYAALDIAARAARAAYIAAHAAMLDASDAIKVAGAWVAPAR